MRKKKEHNSALSFCVGHSHPFTLFISYSRKNLQTSKFMTFPTAGYLLDCPTVWSALDSIGTCRTEQNLKGLGTYTSPMFSTNLIQFGTPTHCYLFFCVLYLSIAETPVQAAKVVSCDR